MLSLCYQCILVGSLQAKVILRHILRCEKFDCHFHVNPYYYVLMYLMIKDISQQVLMPFGPKPVKLKKLTVM